MRVLADIEYVDPSKPVAIVPILRAGMAMLEQANSSIPFQATYHVGYARNETTLEAHQYLNKLPPTFDMDSKVIVTDIMLATGARGVGGWKGMLGEGVGALLDTSCESKATIDRDSTCPRRHDVQRA